MSGLANTLAYDNPAVFFAGVYRHRSRDTLVGAGAFALFGLLAGAVALAGPIDHPFRPMVGGLAAVLLLLAGFLAALAAADRQEAVRITEGGITYGRQFWPWDRVTFVGGVADRGGVLLEFRSTVAGVIPVPRPLPTTPPLTADQFARLTAAVGAYLAAHHPRVRVDPRPRSLD